MGNLLTMPRGGTLRRTLIKRHATGKGLAVITAGKMRTWEIVAWLRQHVRHDPLGKTGS